MRRSSLNRHRSRLGSDRGSSIIEFSMITVLLVMLLLAVIQVAGLFYVRSVAAAAASDGARYAADAGVDADQGGPRATDLIGKGLSRGLAAQLPCTSGAVVDPGSGLTTDRVDCRGRIRSVFLPIGAFVTVHATGQSLEDGP